MKIYKIIVLAVLWCSPPCIQTHSKEFIVPTTVQFADMELHLTPQARKRVQDKVDTLIRSKRLFQILLNRVNLWFPFIEQVLSEEQVPNDFKYLAVQESALLGNMISHTNDVGFWQIHKVAATELKININAPIDERMHIITSTRAAARFLKGHQAYFKSWLGALLAYNKGRKGAERKFPKKNHGAKKVKIEGKADFYIIHFIAHKLVFEKLAGKATHPTLRIFEYKKPHGQTLQDISKKFSVEEGLLKEHNAWLKCHIIPHDSPCSVIIPMSHSAYHQVLPSMNTNTMYTRNRPISNSINYTKDRKNNTFPAIKPYQNNKSPRIVKVNNLPGIVAQPDDTLAQLASLGKLSLSKFLAINEADRTHRIIPGQVYYYTAKNSKAGKHYHTVKANETLWHISQLYGVRIDALLCRNRMGTTTPLEVGRVLWLRFIRPKNIVVAYEK